MSRITDEMVERALAENIGLIQGFSYATKHCIRDFRHDSRGIEIWSIPRLDTDPEVHAKFQRQIEVEKFRAQMFAAMRGVAGA